jgi:hypothetical protein
MNPVGQILGKQTERKALNDVVLGNAQAGYEQDYHPSYQ